MQDYSHSLQQPVIAKSSTKVLSIKMPERRINLVLGRSLSLRVNTMIGNIVASSIDSDLEAFSHYLTDGSFGALPGQATP